MLHLFPLFLELVCYLMTSIPFYLIAHGDPVSLHPQLQSQLKTFIYSQLVICHLFFKNVQNVTANSGLNHAGIYLLLF